MPHIHSTDDLNSHKVHILDQHSEQALHKNDSAFRQMEEQRGYFGNNKERSYRNTVITERDSKSETNSLLGRGFGDYNAHAADLYRANTFYYQGNKEDKDNGLCQCFKKSSKEPFVKPLYPLKKFSISKPENTPKTVPHMDNIYKSANFYNRGLKHDDNNLCQCFKSSNNRKRVPAKRPLVKPLRPLRNYDILKPENALKTVPHMNQKPPVSLTPKISKSSTSFTSSTSSTSSSSSSKPVVETKPSLEKVAPDPKPKLIIQPKPIQLGNRIIRKVYPPLCSDYNIDAGSSRCCNHLRNTQIYEQQLPMNKCTTVDSMNQMLLDCARRISQLEKQNLKTESRMSYTARGLQKCGRLQTHHDICCEKGSQRPLSYEMVGDLFQSLSDQFMRPECIDVPYLEQEKPKPYFNIEMYKMLCGKERIVINKM